jgi:hypothetical protein
MAMSMLGNGKPNVAAEGGARDRIVGTNGAGFTHAPAFNHGAAGGRLPSTRSAFRGRHAACLSEAQMRKVDGLEHGCCSKALNRVFTPWQHVERPFFEGLNELGKVSGVGHRGQVRSLTDGQQTQGQTREM